MDHGSPTKLHLFFAVFLGCVISVAISRHMSASSEVSLSRRVFLLEVKEDERWMTPQFVGLQVKTVNNMLLSASDVVKFPEFVFHSNKAFGLTEFLPNKFEGARLGQVSYHFPSERVIIWFSVETNEVVWDISMPWSVGL